MKNSRLFITKRLFTLLALIIMSLTVMAQQQVKGVVSDSKGEPIVGATVYVTGQDKAHGTVTDVDGVFELKGLTGNEVLEVSYIGYLPQKVKIAKRKNLSITLAEDTKVLDDVVVVGYGTQKKGLVTSAVSTLKGDDVLTTTSTNTVSRIQGKVSGLGIRQNTGEPGSDDFSINVRGFGEPIFIVDGTERISASDFNRMNPEDIDNISVLKDGSAAVYGMNAGNGVVLITTKKGEKGSVLFNLGAVASFSSPTNIPKMMNSVQYMTMRNEASYNVGGTGVYAEEEIEKYRSGELHDTNWYDATMKGSTMNQIYNFSAQGGSGKVHFYTSLSYTREPGLLRSNDMDYERYNFRSHVTTEFSKRLTFGVQIHGEWNHRKSSYWNIFNIMRGTVSTLPMHSIYANDNPNYYNYTYDGQSYNPVAISDADLVGGDFQRGKAYSARASLTYLIPGIKGLKAQGILYYSSTNIYRKRTAKSFNWYGYDSETDTYTPHTYGYPTSMYTAWRDYNTLTMQAQLTYDRTFANAHHVGGTLVYEQRRTENSTSDNQRYFSYYVLDQMSLGDSEDQLTNGTDYRTGFKSWIGKFTYDYKGKYMAEFDFRYDGSYRYHPDHRWGFFPVYQLGWRVSQESWFKKALPFVSNFKLRGSYGIVGEDAGSAFQYYSGFTLNSGGYEFSDGSWTSGAKAPSVTNPSLTWYKSHTMDFGIDAGLFNNQLEITFDIYRRNRKGLLTTRARTLPDTFGASLPQENLNKDRTDGVEFSINWRKRVNKDFSYSIAGNFNFARTKWIYVERQDFDSSYLKWLNGQSGRWSDIVWCYQVIGQFQSEEEIANSPDQDGMNFGTSKQTLPGDFKYKDVNGDGVINSNDMLPTKWNGTPKMHYGLTLSAKYKWFDATMLWQGSAKYTVRFGMNYAMMFWNDGNMPEYFYDRWHKADYNDPDSEWIPGKWPAARTTTDNPSLMYSESAIWRRDASYLRLKSVEVGFSFPRPWLKALNLKSARIYMSAYNLLTLCSSFVRPFDPEKVEGSYSAGWNYPLNKTYNIGINVKF